MRGAVKPALLVMALSAVIASGCTRRETMEPADTIYFGGNIITVDAANPVVEAVAVRGGRIAAAGSLADLSARNRGASTRMVDLAGRTMLPGFIDPHSHLIMGLLMEDQANVTAPPVGPASTAGEIVAELRKFAAARARKPGDFIIGYGYDDNLLPADHPLTRLDLDPAFPDNPVVVIHVSAHGAVLNSAALKRFNITAATRTPPGGVIARLPGSQEPSGLLMETAWLSLHEQLPALSRDQEQAAIRFAQGLYAAAGVTTAQDGATMEAQVETLQRVADRGDLYIDVVSYPFIADLDRILARHPAPTFGKYNHHLKLGGCKILTDGSPQGRTAFFTTPYLTGGPGGEQDWRGEPTFPQDILDGMFRQCYANGLQAIVHANGDAAIDMALAAHEAAIEADPGRDRRTVVIHSQFVRRDQLQKYADLKLIPSFYTEHTFFFGEAHVKNRGLEQASFISPMKTAIAMGLKPTNHTDFSVVPIDQMMVLWSAVNRTMRNGQVLGPEERVSPMEAIRAITLNAAYQYFEEGSKGSIHPGKLADLVILDRNPLTIPVDDIRHIRVVETIKEGRTIYPRP